MKRVSILFDPAWPSDAGGVELQLVSPKDNAILEDNDSIRINGVLTATVDANEIRIVARDPTSTLGPVSALVGDSACEEVSTLDGAHGKQQLGFSLQLPASARRAAISLCVSGVEVPVCTLSTATVFKVQRGGVHLFLDNDTNRSVDQYTGRLLLDQANLARWQTYAAALRRMDESGVAVRLLICPAKEELFQDLYPHRRAPRAPIDQVADVCDGRQLVYPIEALRSERESTYSTVDTHWSDYGAKVGAAEYLRSVSLSHATRRLPEDFYPRRVYGDLGGKIDGGQAGVFMTLAKGYRFSVPCFDNGIGNHGRVWTYTNENAEIRQTLVIFGDSFAVSLSAILASVFSRVVYCYTAAGIDPEVVRVERPAYILAQTNQRFIINAPSAEASVFRQVAQKVSTLDVAACLSMLERFGEKSVEPYYAARMRELLLAAKG